MGDTFCQACLAGGVDALEGVFGYGRASSFVARLLEGEAMSEVCREFGISRKTGYKIFDRYKDHGLQALSDRSRRPVRYANQLPPQIESLITACKREKPHGAPAKSANFWCASSTVIFVFPPRARSTRFYAATIWSSPWAARAVAPRGRPCPKPAPPTRFGAPTSRASSSSAMDAIAIPLP